MRGFVLGGTGSIGSAVVQELTRRGHDALALARSDMSAAKSGEIGATPDPTWKNEELTPPPSERQKRPTYAEELATLYPNGDFAARPIKATRYAR